ncbi:hypothetical protein RND81_06G206500 [Saponaria officinalis]|uniref:DUF6598 domain-containing protein n=1 Tax=Saponaria officinalis TaxID=3572 RepID=A0AAW1KDY5_SAPOF
MVGYEPDLNPCVDWKKELEYLLSDDPPPVTKIARVSKPVTKPPETSTAAQDTYYTDRLVTPLIQVFSVRFVTDFDEDKPREIYGSIRVSEGSDAVFDLYDRGPGDSETICKDGTLSLIGPNDNAIVPLKATTLDLCLSDRVQGVEVVKGSLSLDPVGEDSYDRLLKVVVEGAHGVAYVYYAVFRFAVYGTVHVNVTKNDDALDIYGYVVAEYGNGRMYCDADDEVTCLETRLLDVPSHRPLHVVVGEPTSIELPRNVAVVPAYSTLNIQVNLWDSNGKIASDCLQFPAHLLREDPLYIRTLTSCVEVQVHWHHAYYHLYRYQKRVNPRRVELSKEGELRQMTGVSDKHLSASVDPSCWRNHRKAFCVMWNHHH